MKEKQRKDLHFFDFGHFAFVRSGDEVGTCDDVPNACSVRVRVRVRVRG